MKSCKVVIHLSQLVHTLGKKTKNLKVNPFNRIFSKLSFPTITFKNRLLIAISAILLFSTLTIGFTTYVKSKESTIDLVSSRLEREVTISNDMAKTLMLVHIGNIESFMKELDAVIKRQHVSITQSGFLANMQDTT